MTKKEQFDIIESTLKKHLGRKNAIDAWTIGVSIGIYLHKDKDATHKKSRQIIKECINERNLPISSCNRGYFFIDNEKEFTDYIDNLENRITEIEKRKEMIIKIYNDCKESGE